MMFALVTPQGLEYPISEEDAQARSIPAHLLTEVVYDNAPGESSLKNVWLEQQTLKNNQLHILYVNAPRTTGQMVEKYFNLYQRIQKTRSYALAPLWMELKRELEKHLQYLLDTWAAKRGFVDLEDMVSLQNSPLSHYRQSAADAIKLRDNVWVSFYKYLQAVDSGVKTPAGTLNEVLLQCYPIRD